MCGPSPQGTLWSRVVYRYTLRANLHTSNGACNSARRCTSTGELGRRLSFGCAGYIPPKTIPIQCPFGHVSLQSLTREGLPRFEEIYPNPNKPPVSLIKPYSAGLSGTKRASNPRPKHCFFLRSKRGGRGGKGRERREGTEGEGKGGGGGERGRSKGAGSKARPRAVFFWGGTSPPH